MSAQRRSGVRSPKVAASLAAGAMLVSMGFGLSPSQASPSPSPAPETTDDGHTNPDFTPPETVDTYVGQSVQARKTADGVQNAHLANFRWAVTQVNAESLNGLDVSVPLPMDDTPGLRSLTGGSNAPTEVDGGVLYDFDDVNGISTKRTLNLWPQDRELPVDVRAQFTLDGETVNAADIVGKGGLVTAKYTIVNKSVKNQNVDYENVSGEPDTQAVDTSQAFVGISKQFIPQSWAQFDPGHGIFGADGRGNFQTQWITLAFLPFAEGGEASFGWSAVIPDGQGFIPKMVIEVSPLYVPAHAAEEEAEGAASSNGVPMPNLDPATATIHAGVEQLINSLQGIAALLPESEPCDPASANCTLTAKLSSLLEEKLKPLSKTLGDAIIGLTPGESGGKTGTEMAAVVQSIIDSNDETLTTLGRVKNLLNCEAAQGQVAQACSAVDLAIKSLTAAQEDLKALHTQLVNIGDQPVDEILVNQVKTELQDVKDAIDDVIRNIETLLSTIANAQQLASDAAAGKAQISTGLGMASSEVSAFVAQVAAAAQAAAASGKDAAEAAKESLNHTLATLAGLKLRMTESPLPYSGGFNTAYAPAGDPSAVQNAATGMLPNNTPPDPEAEAVSGVTPTAELFGAYQFMLDPADSNKPNTPWRILLAVLFVVGAGFIGKRVASSKA